MSNSALVDYIKLSPNHSGLRKHKIDTITIHHMAGNLSVETCGEGFANHTRKASSNYGIGSDGRVGLYVDEANRAWTSGNADNDHRAITIEVANDGGAPDWHISDKALEKTIELCADICKRNGIEKLNFTGDKSGNLTMHKWFQATLCPGPYLESKFPYIAEEVNKRLCPAVLYRVQVGAYKEKKNADRQYNKVKKAGFEAILVQVDGLYKVQVGAFKVYGYAEAMLDKIKKAGFSAYITTKGGTVVVADPVKEIKVGSIVRVKNGAKDYNGGGLASFIYERNHTVKEISGNRVVITFNGVVVAAVHKDNLILL